MKWATVSGTDGLYEASDTGKIRKLFIDRGRIRYKLLTLTTTTYRYKSVSIRRHGKFKSLAVHRLVYEAHVGKIPRGRQINHINCKRDDNRISNLESVTPYENICHAVKMRYRNLPKRLRFKSYADLKRGNVLNNAITAPGLVRLMKYAFQLVTFERYANKLGLQPIMKIGKSRFFYKPDAMKVIKVMNRFKRTPLFAAA